MPNNAEGHSHAFTTNRNCTIEITNSSSTFCLVNPKVHMESGFVYNPPQPTLRPSMTELCSFDKNDNTASGAVGVMTYELFHMQSRKCSELMAVMFSVPFDYNFYQNWLGLGIFESTKPCDTDLFDLMYHKDQEGFQRHEADGSGVTYQGSQLEVRGTMSDEGKAIIKLELYDKRS